MLKMSPEIYPSNWLFIYKYITNKSPYILMTKSMNLVVDDKCFYG